MPKGVVMIAVCNKREVRSDADARRDVESELRNEEGVALVAWLSSRFARFGNHSASQQLIVSVDA
jgi:hypothetical protein